MSSRCAASVVTVTFATNHSAIAEPALKKVIANIAMIETVIPKAPTTIGGVPSLLSRSPSLPDSDADGLGKTQRNHECRGCAGDRDLMSGERSRPQPAHH